MRTQGRKLIGTLLPDQLMTTWISYRAQNHVTMDDAAHSRHQLIIRQSCIEMPTCQFGPRKSSQVTIGCVKLTIKTNYNTYICGGTALKSSPWFSLPKSLGLEVKCFVPELPGTACRSKELTGRASIKGTINTQRIK